MHWDFKETTEVHRKLPDTYILQNPQILASSRKPLRRENDPKSLILVDVAFVTWLDILEEYNSVSY